MLYTIDFYHTYSCVIALDERKVEEDKQVLSEKGSNVRAKGAEIFGTAQKALTSGAEAVTEKTKHGIEAASETVSNVKTVTGELASNAQAKVAETAHNAQGSHISECFRGNSCLCLVKASELLTNIEIKATSAADTIATKTVETKNSTVAAAQNAASTVQGKILSLFYTEYR